MKKFGADHILSEGILKGDTAAFQVFFKKYYQQLLGFVTALAQDKDQAEDIAQLAFITLWKERNNIKKPYNLKQYLFATAKNLFIDHYRSTKTRSALYAELTTEALNEHLDEDEEYVQSQIRKLKKIIETLPDRCQTVLRMTKFEGYSQQETADYLGISIRTVESQMRLAYQRIREQFDQDDPIILFFLATALKPIEKNRKSNRRSFLMSCQFVYEGVFEEADKRLIYPKKPDGSFFTFCNATR